MTGSQSIVSTLNFCFVSIIFFLLLLICSGCWWCIVLKTTEILIWSFSIRYIIMLISNQITSHYLYTYSTTIDKHRHRSACLFPSVLIMLGAYESDLPLSQHFNSISSSFMPIEYAHEFNMLVYSPPINMHHNPQYNKYMTVFQVFSILQ